MKVFLHSCCAPCTTYPLFLLRSLGHSVDGVFHNPNIYPRDERERRLAAYMDFAAGENLTVLTLGLKDAKDPPEGALGGDAPVFSDVGKDAEHEGWMARVSRDLAKPGRCRLCYLHRLLPVAYLAKEAGYDAFTTSLLLSIYQDHEGIAEAGEEAARQAGVPFLYHDFRVGYRRSREMARGRHLYMQKYCGCEFSVPSPDR